MSERLNIASATVTDKPEFLCADMDGTLLEGDSLWESLLALLGTHPWYVFLLPFWLLGGKAYLKRAIASRAKLNVLSLPLREDLVEYLKQEKQSGRKLILATAADRSIATAVAERLGIFDAVLASDGKTNLAGARKTRAIQTFLDGREFDYAANSRADLPVWACAKHAILVGPSESLLRTARKTLSIDAVFARRKSRWSALLHALRPQHWVKNLLIFVPLAMAHEVQDRGLLMNAVVAFISFSLCASGIYILNDLFDLESDRLHHSKKTRPFASGAVPLWAGMVLSPLLLLCGFLVGYRLSQVFLVEVVVYALSSLLYSAYGKRVPLLDVLMLTGLYLLRILAGGVATSTPVSPWLLAFSMFLMLSLAFAKRFMELMAAQEPHDRDHPRSASKRNYSPEDANMVRQFGITSGYISVLVLALYVNSPQVMALYRTPQWIWLACPLLLFWISRVWFLANRGLLHEDPVVFALQDSMSYVLGAIIVLILFAAS